MKSFLKSAFQAYTLVEIMVALVIICFLIITSVASYNSLINKKALQSEAEAVKQDMYLMQSRAVTSLRTQRFYIITNSSYRLEENDGTGNWSTTQTARSFRTGIYFYGHTGKETSLWYETSGLPNFNGQSATPFFSLIYNTTAEKKDLNIDSSGVVSIVAN